MRRTPIFPFTLMFTGLIALPLTTAAGSTWNGNTDMWTDNDDTPWQTAAPNVADSSSGFGDDVNLTQSTAGDITITYEADAPTGDESTQGTRFGEMTLNNSGGGTTTLLLDDSDDTLPNGGNDSIGAGGKVRVQAGTYSPEKHLVIDGGAVEQAGGLVEPRRYDTRIRHGSYSISAGILRPRNLQMSGSNGPATMTVSSTASVQVGRFTRLGGNANNVTVHVNGGDLYPKRLEMFANAELNVAGGDVGHPTNNSARPNYIDQHAGTVNHTSGFLGAKYSRHIGTVQGQTATYNISGGTMGGGRALVIGATGNNNSAPSVGGEGVLNHTGGTVAVGGRNTFVGGLYIGHPDASQTSVYHLQDGSLTGGHNLTVTENGEFRGYGTPTLNNNIPAMRNSGRVIADGGGTERTLDMSNYVDGRGADGDLGEGDGGVTNPTDNPADGNNGYFATGQGKLVLPDVLNVASSNGSTYNFGESQSDSSIDLINSAQFTFNGLDDSGRSLSGALLDPARSDVDTGGLEMISVHDFDLSGSGGFTDFDLTLRYDQTALESGEESILRLMHFDGSNWVDITSSRDTANNLITANGVDSFSQFGVTTTIPEPASLALLAPAGLLLIRRRRG